MKPVVPIWCAACGKWGDHASGSCPSITPSIPSTMTIGEQIIAAIAEKRLIRHDDPFDRAGSFSPDAADQLTALVHAHVEAEVKRRTQEGLIAQIKSLDMGDRMLIDQLDRIASYRPRQLGAYCGGQNITDWPP